MADLKNQVDCVENESTMKTDAQANDEYEKELQQALRDYVPGTVEEKKLVRKIDLLLMPCLWIMYILNYVDRTNIVSLKFYLVLP
jgi:hypothetical protein